MTRPHTLKLTAAAICLALAGPLFGAAPAAASGDLIIRDFVLTHGVYEREPVDAVESFSPADERGYLFARIANDGAPTNVTVIWYRDGVVHGHVALHVGSSTGWRTWSSANLTQGDWRVELMTDTGVVLAERSFPVAYPVRTGDSGDGMLDLAPASGQTGAPIAPGPSTTSSQTTPDWDG